MNSKRELGAIILAAGRGKRMNSKNINKVALMLDNKPIITHIVQFMKRLGIAIIVVVVGHAKESVYEAIHPEKVIYADQAEQLGTGHAVHVALEKLPKNVTDVFVVYGDDAVFYNEKNKPFMKKLFDTQLSSGSVLSFLTIEINEPAGLGRIVRDKKGNVTAIVEEKDATGTEKRITEINPGCFVFSVKFLKKYLPKVTKSPVTGEYYLTGLIDLAIKDRLNIETVRGGILAWRGVNTKEELEGARKMRNER